jgi:hypothetical protein
LSTRWGKRELSNYIGQIGETLACRFLKEQGFEVRSFMTLADFSKDLDSKFRRIPNGEEFIPQSIIGVREFLGSKKGDFLKEIYPMVDVLTEQYYRVN